MIFRIQYHLANILLVAKLHFFKVVNLGAASFGAGYKMLGHKFAYFHLATSLTVIL